MPHIGLIHDVDLRNKSLHRTTLLGLLLLLHGVRSKTTLPAIVDLLYIGICGHQCSHSRLKLLK